jgi:serine/threonine protein kinase
MQGKCDLDAALEAWGTELSIDSKDVAVGESIGTGCTAQVFTGTWRGREVAVKRLPTDEKMTPFFVRELGVMSRTRHPNLVRLLGFCHGASTFDVVLEICRGGNLFSLLHISDVEVTTRQQYKIAQDTAKGMAYLHGLTPPVVHRDLKSLNVLLCEPIETLEDVPLAKVTDFGLAKMRFDGGGPRSWPPFQDCQPSGRRRRRLRPLQNSLPLKQALYPTSSLPVGRHTSWCTSSSGGEGGFATFREDGGSHESDGRRVSLTSCGDLNSGVLRKITEDHREGMLALKAPDQASSSAASSKEELPPMDRVQSDTFHDRPGDDAAGGLRLPDGAPVQGGRAASRLDRCSRSSMPCIYNASVGFDSLGCGSTAVASTDDGTMTCNVGTLQWMSPELMSGDTNYSVKVDVYAYGMLLYEIMCFEPPFADLDPAEVQRFVLEGGRPEIDWEAMSPPLVRLTQACWAQEAERRPTFSFVVGALEALQRQETGDCG